MHVKNEEYATFTGVCNSVATIKQSMDRIKEATHMLNPGQTPVMVSDQLLFALANQIQWTGGPNHMANISLLSCLVARTLKWQH